MCVQAQASAARLNGSLMTLSLPPSLQEAIYSVLISTAASVWETVKKGWVWARSAGAMLTSCMDGTFTLLQDSDLMENL